MQWLFFSIFFSWLRGGERYFKWAGLATKTWIINRVLSQAIVPHVKLLNFVWRALARISREIFTWISRERDFPLNLCENHVSFHMNFTWISDETSRKNHMKLFSREAQLAVLCIKKLKIMQNGQLKTVSLLFRRTWCILPSNTIMFALVDNVTIFSS